MPDIAKNEVKSSYRSTFNSSQNIKNSHVEGSQGCAHTRLELIKLAEASIPLVMHASA
jgi:hypothetical protein